MDASGITAALGSWATGAGPLYRRLADALGAAVRSGAVTAGTRLPAERTLARALAVSRTTVVEAYAVLRRAGLLESHRGSGTYVRPGGAPGPLPSRGAPNTLFRQLVEGSGTAIELTAACLPALPMVADAVRDVPGLDAMLAQPGYLVRGLPALREAIAAEYTRVGLPTDAEQILVTSGGQQAIALCAQLFVTRGGTVVTENPTFPGALDVFAGIGARVVPTPVGPAGVDVDALRDATRREPAQLLYLMPTFHNPTGTVVPAPGRRALARLAAEVGVPLVDDSTLDTLTHAEPPPPPVAAFAPAEGVVLTLGSLSKLFWGGLRIGWVRASEEAVAQLARVKVTADIGTTPLAQGVAASLIPRIPEAQVERRAQMLASKRVATGALADLLPDWTWVEPAGGLSLWARLPHGHAGELAQVALRHGVAIVPGSAMTPDGSHTEHVRLPLLAEQDILAEGLRRLAAAWAAYAPPFETSRRGVHVLV